MKTVLIFLLGAVVGIGGVYLQHKFGMQGSKTPYVLDLDISDGKRVPLKDGVTVDAFEDQLRKVDPNGANGTLVDIKPNADKPDEVEGPLADNSFRPPNKPIGPDGSMHNTQRVYAATTDDVKSVLDMLGSSSKAAATGSVGTAAPAEPTTPTPAPSP